MAASKNKSGTRKRRGKSADDAARGADASAIPLQKLGVAEGLTRQNAPRIQHFVRLRCDARMSTGDATNALMEHWGISRSTAENDAAAGNRSIEQAAPEVVEVEVAKSIRSLGENAQRMADLRDAALGDGDRASAVSAARELRGCVGDISKLLGLNAPNRIEHSGKIDTGPDFTGLTDEQADQLRALVLAGDKSKGESES